MILELHDNSPVAPGEMHGPGGPTHTANLSVDYEYQLEQWLIDLPSDRPDVVRVMDRAGRRQWLLGGDGFKRAAWPHVESVAKHPWLGRTVGAAGELACKQWIVDRVVMRGASVVQEHAVEPWAELVSANARERAVAPLSALRLVDAAR